MHQIKIYIATNYPLNYLIIRVVIIFVLYVNLKLLLNLILVVNYFNKQFDFISNSEEI